MTLDQRARAELVGWNALNQLSRIAYAIEPITTPPDPEPAPKPEPERLPVMPHHALVAEGAAFLLDPLKDERPYRVMWNTVGGRGRGLCSCGEMSEVLDSGAQRKTWHRGHKLEKIAAPPR